MTLFYVVILPFSQGLIIGGGIVSVAYALLV